MSRKFSNNVLELAEACMGKLVLSRGKEVYKDNDAMSIGRWAEFDRFSCIWLQEIDAL